MFLKEYLNIIIPLCSPMLELKPGRHRFQMRVAIPDNTPSSFESQFGSISYTIKLNLFTNALHVRNEFLFKKITLNLNK